MNHYTRRGADRYMAWSWIDNVVVGALVLFGVLVVGHGLGVW